MTYTELATAGPSEPACGLARAPLTTQCGLTIGGGQVHPELSFTLPAMSITEERRPEVLRTCREIASDAAARSRRRPRGRQ